jgi:hypothetical protein
MNSWSCSFRKFHQPPSPVGIDCLELKECLAQPLFFIDSLVASSWNPYWSSLNPPIDVRRSLKREGLTCYNISVMVVDTTRIRILIVGSSTAKTSISIPSRVIQRRRSGISYKVETSLSTRQSMCISLLFSFVASHVNFSATTNSLINKQLLSMIERVAVFGENCVCCFETVRPTKDDKNVQRAKLDSVLLRELWQRYHQDLFYWSQRRVYRGMQGTCLASVRTISCRRSLTSCTLFHKCSWRGTP